MAAAKRALLAAAILALAAAPAWAQGTTIIPKGSTWRYLDTNTRPASWESSGFNDAGWAQGAGPLGYGDPWILTTVGFGADPNNKYITTCFRFSFNVVSPAAYSGLTFNIMRDDGVVVYLNGAEVVRDNMPGGAVAHTTLASIIIGGGAESSYNAFARANTLVAGTNVIAVEVHQSAANSSDLGFDLELIGTGELTRGPYLQQGTPTAVTVRWRTVNSTVGRVRYGSAPGSFASFVDEAGATTEHAVNVTGLAADTVYYYSVGTAASEFAGNDPNHLFLTHPAATATKPTRIWVLGDSGTAGPTGSNPNQTAVKNAYTTYTASRHTDLWLMLGDNAYEAGTDAEFQNAVFNMYPEMLRKSVLWSTVGNHETDRSQTFSAMYPYFQIHTFPTAAQAGGVASGTEQYYSFDHGNIHFICLDSQTSSRAATPVDAADGPMATWLRADLLATTKTWIVAYWHHPPYSKGSHNSDSESQLIEMRTRFNRILESGGVDLVLTGHSHSYERSYLLNGHYGDSTTFSLGTHAVDSGSGREDTADGAYAKPVPPAANQGAVYTVAGSSGKTSGGTLNHPAMYISLNLLGSVVMDVNGNRLDFKFLRETGAIGDYFNLIKGDSTPPAAVTLSVTGRKSSSVSLQWLAPGDDGAAGTATTYDIRYSTTGPITEDNWMFARRATGEPAPLAAITSQSFTVTGLSASAPYWFSIRTADEVWNCSPVSNSPTATTSAGGDSTPPAAVSNLSVTGRTGATVTLQWTAPGDDGSTGTAASYDIRYSASPITGANFASATQAAGEPVPTAAGTTQSFTVAGLSPSTTYYFALRASDEVPNASATSNSPSGTTLDTVAPAAVSNLSVTGQTTTTITLQWTASGDDGGTGTAASYDIRYSLAAITAGNWAAATTVTGEPAPTAAGTTQNFTVTGLSPTSTYFFAIRTSDEVPNLSAVSNSPSGTTVTPPDTTAPAAVSNLSITTQTSLTVSLQWTAPGDDGGTGTATSYDIRYSTSPITAGNWGAATQVTGEPAPTAAGTTQAYTVTGLSPSTLYYFAIRTDDGVPNTSNLSNVASGSTTPPELSVTPATGFTSSGPFGGPFAPGRVDYTVSNAGTIPIDFTVAVAVGPPTWLGASSAGATLNPGTNVIVTLTVDQVVASGMAQENYLATVTFTNTTNGSGTTIRGVALAVGGLAVTASGTTFSPGGVEGGPFTPASFTYTVSNTGTVPIDWAASVGQPWLMLSSTGGTLAVGGAVTVTITIDPALAALLVPGTYNDSVVFLNTTNGVGDTARAVSLTVGIRIEGPTARHCGLLGFELLLPLALLGAFWRRMRR